MISGQDFAVIGLLIFLEGILSIDNAIVLALLAKPLPKAQQKRALTYGLVGAIVFRLIAVAFASALMQWRWVKFVGSAYLIWISLKHFLSGGESGTERKGKHAGFWKTVLVIELTDIAFAVDSILAAVALSQKYWVVFTGGMVGVVLMRFAATFFIKALEKFPSFEVSAYMLVLLIGVKLLLDGLRIPGIDFHSSGSPAFWIFWGMMLCMIAYGFKPVKKHRPSPGP